MEETGWKFGQQKKKKTSSVPKTHTGSTCPFFICKASMFSSLKKLQKPSAIGKVLPGEPYSLDFNCSPRAPGKNHHEIIIRFRTERSKLFRPNDSSWWLNVSTHLKNMRKSNWELIGVKMKKIWNHPNRSVIYMWSASSTATEKEKFVSIFTITIQKDGHLVRWPRQNPTPELEGH